MNDNKSAVASTGVWGSLIALAGAVAPLVLNHLGVSDADQQALVSEAGQTAAAIGGAIALYGRLKATKRIG